MRNRKGGFTLVELLAVVVVLGLLASLTLAVEARARRKVETTVAVLNLRQLGLAAQLYAADNDGQFPQSQHQRRSWMASLQPYAAGTNLFRAPRDPHPTRVTSYAINDYLTVNPAGAKDLDFSRARSLARPQETLFMAVCQESYEGSDHFHFAEGRLNELTFRGQVLVELYGDASLYLFADGNAGLLTWEEVRNRIRRPGSRLVHPDGLTR
jgi:prepilin-type N-terminal cleavage/methylation domain-containing protein